MAARNVLLTHDLNAKVADFGLSSRIYVTLEEELVKGSNQDTVPYRWAAYETLFQGETIKGEKNLNTTASYSSTAEAKIKCDKNVRAMVSMVSYLKN